MSSEQQVPTVDEDDWLVAQQAMCWGVPSACHRRRCHCRRRIGSEMP